MGGSWLAYVFFWCVGLITVGLLWFRVLRPMLEDFGLIRPSNFDEGVNDYPEARPVPPPDYVAQPTKPLSVSRVSPLVTEAETERETEAEIYQPPPQAVETSYIRMTQQQLDQLKARAWLEGAGHAVGTLQGAGYLDAVISSERLTDAKRAVFGSSGRTLTTANKLIAAAAAKVQPAEDDVRLVPVRDGEEGYIEV
jgi:hypothetical protein